MVARVGGLFSVIAVFTTFIKVYNTQRLINKYGEKLDIERYCNIFNLLCRTSFWLIMTSWKHTEVDKKARYMAFLGAFLWSLKLDLDVQKYFVGM